LTISHNNGSSDKERTEVVYGPENVMNIILQFLSKANSIDSCGDNKAPKIAIEVDEYRKLLIDLKKREIKVRYITDISKGNIKYCKELMNFFEEIRHLDGIKANFSISEKEYLASAALLQKEEIERQQHQQQQSKELAQQVIYSNVKDIVEQQKYVFESFWNKAIPAEERIKEIEQGITLGTTEVIQIPTSQVRIPLLMTSDIHTLVTIPAKLFLFS
jgi:predicted nucleic acid-binding OB-fold protein